MARVADTSLLYAAFDAADPRHKQAQDEIAKPQALNIPLCIMAEFLDLVAYRSDAKTARQVHADLLGLPTVTVTPLHDESDVFAIWAQHADLSVIDAAGIQACIEGNHTLLSHDARQEKTLATLRSTV